MGERERKKMRGCWQGERGRQGRLPEWSGKVLKHTFYSDFFRRKSTQNDLVEIISFGNHPHWFPLIISDHQRANTHRVHLLDSAVHGVIWGDCSHRGHLSSCLVIKDLLH